MVNLFFTSSYKKYSSNHSLQELTSLIRLSEIIETKFEEKIIAFDQNYIEYATDENLALTSYFVEEPILNHDYMVLWGQI